MKEFRYRYLVRLTTDIKIDANSDEEARKKAKNMPECRKYYDMDKSNDELILMEVKDKDIDDFAKYYFLAYKFTPQQKTHKILIIRDCLTIPYYTVQEIASSDLNTDTIFGYNNIINGVVYGHKSLATVINALYYNYKQLYCNSLVDYYPVDCVFDIVNLKTKEIVSRFDLKNGRSVDIL